MEKLAFTQMQDSTKGEYAALLTRPFVREQCAWSVQTHGDFQMICYGHHVGGNRNKRDQFKDSPIFDDCAVFCERWDQASFDPEHDNLPLSFFALMGGEMFARTPYDPDVIQAGVRAPLADVTLAANRATA